MDGASDVSDMADDFTPSKPLAPGPLKPRWPFT